MGNVDREVASHQDKSGFASIPTTFIQSAFDEAELAPRQGWTAPKNVTTIRSEHSCHLIR